MGRNLKTWTDYRGFDPEVGKRRVTTGSRRARAVSRDTSTRTSGPGRLGVEVNF